jgi:hypothetical protein
MRLPFCILRALLCHLAEMNSQKRKACYDKSEERNDVYESKYKN